MGLKLLKNILNKRKENGSTNAGFIGGILAGIIVVIFSVAVMILNKELLFQQITTALEQYNISMPVGTLWIVSLVAIPPVIVLIYSIVGIFLGAIFHKFKEIHPILVLIVSAALGVLWGLITNLPASRWSIMAVNIFAWLVFGIVFILLRRKKGD